MAFGAAQITSACQASNTRSYEYFLAGLFKSTDIVELSFTQTNPTDQIQIKFNFASMVQSMKLFITLNDNEIYSNKLEGFSDLKGVFAQSSNSTSRSFLTLPALSPETASSVLIHIDTGLLDYIVKDYTLKIFIQTNSTQTYVWGFSDMVIFSRQCQTCVSQAVITGMSNLSLAIGVTLIIVVLLIVILFVAICL